MLSGHGDDIFDYNDIRSNFSSNIFSHADLSDLKNFLCQNIGAIGSYPEPEARTLEKLIAWKYELEDDCVLVTNGATDAIYLIAQACSANGYKWYRHFIPTFSEYADASSMFGFKEVDGASDSYPNKTLCWLCNPNNPTGTVYSKQHVMQLAQHYGILVVDQSYEDYTLAEMMTPLEAISFPNIIQLHSLTKKYAVPGLRIGYITAASSLIEKLRPFLRPWSVNSLAIKAGSFLIKKDKSIINDLSAYLREAQRLRDSLNNIDGVFVPNTQTNFMLARIDRIKSAELKKILADKYHILIRDASNFQGFDGNWIRVATQKPEENDFLVMALQECLTSIR